MPDSLLDGVDAVVFDILGTLVEDSEPFARGVADVVPDGERAAAVARDWSSDYEKRLTAVSSGRSRWQDELELRARALQDALGRHEVSLAADAIDALMRAGENRRAHGEVAAQLAALGDRVRVVGLTNSSYAPVVTVSQRNRLRWHLLLSTQLVRTFKPNPAAYELPPTLLGLPAGRLLFVAAHHWDLAGAAAHGYRTAFLARPDSDPPGDHVPDVQLDSLWQLVGR